MILEGIVTTINNRDVARDPSRSEPLVNVSPMGPEVNDDMKTLVLRPYRTSRTYHNLKEHGEGVFHVVDDVDLLARAAVGEVDPPLRKARRVRGFYLEDACRFYEFRLTKIDDVDERTTLVAEVVHQERLRDFFGFHRARHAVVEAAILATRVHLIDPRDILRQFDELHVLVQKTGSAREEEAFRFLRRYVEKEAVAQHATPETPFGEPGSH